MSILALLLSLIVIGVLAYLVNQRIPMEPWIKTVFNIVVVILVILLLLSAFGGIGFLSQQVPRVQ